MPCSILPSSSLHKGKDKVSQASTQAQQASREPNKLSLRVSRPLHAQSDLAWACDINRRRNFDDFEISLHSRSTLCDAKLSLLLFFHHLHRFHLGGNSCLEPNYNLRVHSSYRIFVIPLVPLVCSSYSISVTSHLLLCS
jgi:hypothetical protein